MMIKVTLRFISAVRRVMKITSTCFGVSYGPFGAGVEAFVVHQQSAGWGISGGPQVAWQSLACILGH